MMREIILSITLVITFDYVLIMVKLNGITTKIDKLEEKLNSLKEQKDENTN